MKLTVDKTDLETSLAAINRIIPKSSTIPALYSVLLKGEGHTLTLGATDMQMSLTTSIGAKIEEEGEIAVPGQLLFEYIRTRGDGDIIMEMARVVQPEEGGIGQSRQMQIRSDRGLAAMSIIAAGDYPPLPDSDIKAPSFVVDRATFRQMIAQVVFAASRENAKPILEGCQLQIEGDQLTLAAADGFRLAVARGKLAQSAEAASTEHVVIPSDGLVELQRLLRGDGNLAVTIDGPHHRIFFDLEQGEGTGMKTRLECQTPSGFFPDYEAVIPGDFGSRITFPVVNLQRAVKTASIMARDNNQIIRLVVEKAEGVATLRIDSRSEQVGRAELIIDVVGVEGDGDNRVAVNSKYISDVVPMLKEEPTALMEISGAGKPVVFRPLDSDDYLYVVMPMQVAWLDD